MGKIFVSLVLFAIVPLVSSSNIVHKIANKLERLRGSVSATESSPNVQADDGSVTMDASTADIFGTMLHHENSPQGVSLANWIRQDDWTKFQFTLKRPGRYRLVPHLSCDADAAGSVVEFELANQAFPLTISATGHIQDFVPQDLGIVTLEKAGRYELTIKPQTKVGSAVMGLRQIQLLPVAADSMLADLHLLDPFWKSETVYRESVLCVREQNGELATGTLLFPARKILSVTMSNGSRCFDEGSDFKLSPNGKELVRMESSEIPCLNKSDLFMPKGTRPVWSGGAQTAIPCALAHKTGDPETVLLFDRGHWFHDQQIEVTYVRAAHDWPSTVPTFDAAKLPKTLEKLRSRQKLSIAFSGDSITYGMNSSGVVCASPFMPAYPDLIAAQLRETYGGEVQVVNRAVGGWGVSDGLADVDNLMQHQPDLVLIAYGMNDVKHRNPETYREGIRQMISRIKEAQPDAEIILLSSMVGNEHWTSTPRDMFPKYRDALESLCGDRVSLVDLTAIWSEMLNRKRHCDLTGNGVNHPTDFGHRVYASAVLSLLIDSLDRTTQPFSSSAQISLRTR